ncbi:hypothetical protein B808_249 [Fructilactobacillus florum 8D]|uniref:Uncharacterized protein n=1 Tax=Fructilactobacillus florum 8D TaxID=1221538 RepID=W9EHQ6_9LACO|nr:hypothetical protein [Fructilactobacillus florum]EKK20603.1 hypothetical protein B807_669 [Fructilactobacillus florum 2F]ETO40791.1 hypothetical protein B808_249 [Fructilactobacillus florum 8D]
MKNESSEHRYRHYDFNTTQTRQQKHRPVRIWPWIIGLAVVVLALAISARFIIHRTQPTNSTSQPSTTKPTSKKSQTKQSPPPKPRGEQAQNSPSQTSNQNNEQATPTRTTNTPVTKKATATPSKPADQSESPRSDPSNSTSSEFAQPHVFDSVVDAKNWASATQNNWLAAGYNNYTITQNSQGFYVLTFER